MSTFRAEVVVCSLLVKVRKRQHPRLMLADSVGTTIKLGNQTAKRQFETYARWL